MIRDIKIHAVLNGYVVEVGCQVVVFSTVDALVFALHQYLLNPDMTEKQYSAMPNAKHTLTNQVMAAGPSSARLDAAVRAGQESIEALNRAQTQACDAQYDPRYNGGPR